MLKRTIAISLILLVSLGIILPFADSTAHGVRQSYQVGGRKHHHYRSRAWWRRYRARLRRKRAAAIELAHRNSLLRLPANLNLGNFVAVTPQPATVATNVVNNAAPATVATKTPVATTSTISTSAPVLARTTAVRAIAPTVPVPVAAAPSVPVPTTVAPTVSASTVGATKFNTTRSHAASPTSTIVTSMN